MKTKTTKTTSKRGVVLCPLWHITLVEPTRVRTVTVGQEGVALLTIRAALRAGYDVNVVRRHV